MFNLLMTILVMVSKVFAVLVTVHAVIIAVVHLKENKDKYKLL